MAKSTSIRGKSIIAKFDSKEGAIILKKRLIKLGDDTIKRIHTRMTESAILMKGKMRWSMRTTPKNANGRSLPGNAPAVQTSNLYDSIEYDSRQNEIEVGATSRAQYAKYLEYGAERAKSILLPRPFLGPAVRDEMPRLQKRIEKDITSALKKVGR